MNFISDKGEDRGRCEDIRARFSISPKEKVYTRIYWIWEEILGREGNFVGGEREIWELGISRGDFLFLINIRATVEHFLRRRFGSKSQGSKGVHDEIYPQKLQGR